MGGAVSTGEDNEELVDNLVEADYIKTARIEKALRAVDRGNYYLAEFRDSAYKDLAWKNGNLHLSAPCIYSEVLECLKLSPGQSFLNLGSGTGYLSTVAGLLLGSYGVNHGVEQHGDVVEYAQQRLTEFISNSPALDMMDFCPPLFVVGNCLQLEPSCSVQSYDRIYCGAAVPPEYIGYIRNLVKIGGIVVMPSGDQLLQITRVKEDAWETKSVLPVSFATLVEPSTEDRARGITVILPERQPLKLKEICRSTIRSGLREKISEENPDFKMRSVLQSKRHRTNSGRLNSGDSSDGRAELDTVASRRRRRCIRRILIPIFRADSDDEDQDNSVDADEDDGNAGGAQNDGSNDGMAIAGIGEPQRRRARRPVIAIGTAGVSRRSGGRVQVEDLRWSRFFVGGAGRRAASIDEGNGHDHPQLNEEMEQSEDANRSADEVPPVEEEDIRDSLDFEQQMLLAGHVGNDGHGNSDNDEERERPVVESNGITSTATTEETASPILEISEDQDAAVAGTDDSEKNESTVSLFADSTSGKASSGTGGESSKRCHSESEVPEAEARRKRAAATASASHVPPMCQHWRGSSSEGESDVSDTERETHREQQRRSRYENVGMQKRFSQTMTAKILLLPIPNPLKAFLNYYRN